MVRLSPADRLLLKAALTSGDRATRAWEAWRSANTIDAAEWPSARLFTLVGHQLRKAGTPDPDLERLLGAQRHAWANGVATAREAADASAVLREVDVPSMVLKGVALQHAYPAPGLRAMGDADLLIPEPLVTHALTALARSGWDLDRLTNPEWHSLLLADKGTVARRNGRDLDIHWRAVHGLRGGVDAQLWRLAGQRTVHGRSLCLPHPSHQLVIVLAHGLRDGSASVLQGLCDAMMLLRTGDVDPSQSVDLARTWSRLAALREGIALLHRHAGGDEVEQFTAALGGRRRVRARPSWRDSLGHVARTIEPGRLSVALARAAEGPHTAPDAPDPGRHDGAVDAADGSPRLDPSLPLKPGRRVEMGRPEQAASVCRGGWSGVEPWGRWTDGPRAVLEFSVVTPQPAETWPVTFWVHAHLDARGWQTVVVRLNGRRVAVWRWRDHPTARGEVLRVPVGQPVRIEFRIRRLAPIGPIDRRLAGLALQWFRAQPPAAPTVGASVVPR